MRIVLLLLAMFAGSAAADPKAESDVQVIIGGNFASDHIGPKEYAAVQQRALARPKVYLGVIERVALAASPQALSSLYIPSAIDWIGASTKPEVRALASKLLPVYRRARATRDPKADPYRDRRLDDRIADLVRLAK